MSDLVIIEGRPNS